ncbi:hypothetical protein RRG08_021423 [Elysia crispata]|uniref:Uncharacterized protein n=1 Tax=Elysia crispata TaxID=231223 RepID=A0AAE1A6B5_9GAST|nr:hypothetical protein RRG08_021423 [Elysia crispata]
MLTTSATITSDQIKIYSFRSRFEDELRRCSSVNYYGPGSKTGQEDCSSWSLVGNFKATFPVSHEDRTLNQPYKLQLTALPMEPSGAQASLT